MKLYEGGRLRSTVPHDCRRAKCTRSAGGQRMAGGAALLITCNVRPSLPCSFPFTTAKHSTACWTLGTPCLLCLHCCELPSKPYIRKPYSRYGARGPHR